MHLSIIPPQHSLPLVSPLEQRGEAGGGKGGEIGQLLFKKVLLHTFFLCCNHVPFVVSNALSLHCPVGLWVMQPFKDSRLLSRHAGQHTRGARAHAQTHTRRRVFRSNMKHTSPCLSILPCDSDEMLWHPLNKRSWLITI